MKGDRRFVGDSRDLSTLRRIHEVAAELQGRARALIRRQAERDDWSDGELRMVLEMLGLQEPVGEVPPCLG